MPMDVHDLLTTKDDSEWALIVDHGPNSGEASGQPTSQRQNDFVGKDLLIWVERLIIVDLETSHADCK